MQSKNHAYGWGVKTFNQHLISMVNATNINIGPISGNVKIIINH
jgi:hypothetical protein